MNANLEQNLLSLPSYALNLEVEDLEARTKDRIGIALKYACESWYDHLIEVRGDITAIISALRNFMEEGILAWLEVLSVTGAAGNAVIALEKLMPRLQEVCFGPLFRRSWCLCIPQTRWLRITSFSILPETIFVLRPPFLKLSMSPPPTFIIPL